MESSTYFSNREASWLSEPEPLDFDVELPAAGFFLEAATAGFADELLFLVLVCFSREGRRFERLEQTAALIGGTTNAFYGWKI